MTPASLLNHTLPVVPSGPGRRALLGFLTEALVGFPEWTPAVGELQQWHALIGGMASNKAAQDVERSLAQGLQTKMLERWPVWGPQLAWGWGPLFEATQGFHHRQVQKWLGHPGAPDGDALSKRLFAFPLAGKRFPPRVTLLGAVLWASQANRGAEGPGRTVAALLRAGVDPSVVIDTWGTSALEAAQESEVARQLVASAPSKLPLLLFTWLDPKVPLKTVVHRLKELSTLCRSPEGAAVLPQLKAAFPDLVERVAARLASYCPPAGAADFGPSSVPEWFQVAKQVRSLGRRVGQDCWRPQPEGLSLAGAWARASVVASVQPQYTPNADRLHAMGSALISPHWDAWAGQANGIPSKVWAQLAYGLIPSDKRAHPSTLQCTNEDWAGLPAAVAAMPASPRLWAAVMEWACLDVASQCPGLVQVKQMMTDQALGVLAPSVWPSSFNEAKQQALLDMTGQHKKALRQALLRMAKLNSSLVLSGAEPDIQAAAEKALALHVLSGIQDSGSAKRLLRWVEDQGVSNHWARVKATMESPYVARLLNEMTPSQREVLFGIFLEPALPAGPKPRF